MLYTFSLGAIPSWVRNRVETQGITVAIAILQDEATAASNAGDSVSASVFSNYVTALSGSNENSIAFGIGKGRIGVDFIG